MLSLHRPTPTPKTCTPNILPCRINHNGPVNASSKRYWNPTKSPTSPSISTTPSTNPDTIPSISTAYFRGRKLIGRDVKIPEGYRGVVVVDGKRVLAGKQEDGDREVEGEGDREEEEEVGVLEEHAEFGEFVVWGHECVVGGGDGVGDEYVRGVEEWVGFAEMIHEYDEEKGDGEGELEVKKA